MRKYCAKRLSRLLAAFLTSTLKTPKQRHGGNSNSLQTQADKVFLTQMCYKWRDQAEGAQTHRKLQSMLSAAHLLARFFLFSSTDWEEGAAYQSSDKNMLHACFKAQFDIRSGVKTSWPCRGSSSGYRRSSCGDELKALKNPKQMLLQIYRKPRGSQIHLFQQHHTFLTTIKTDCFLYVAIYIKSKWCLCWNRRSFFF